MTHAVGEHASIATPVLSRWDRYRRLVTPARRLALVSAGQLACGLAGMGVAVRRRRFFDVALVHMRGSPQRVLQESVFNGTALSAPVTMLTLQGVAIAGVARRSSKGWARVLGILGALMVPGFMSERHVRHILSRNGWEPVESLLVVVSMVLSVAMAVLAWRVRPAEPAGVSAMEA